MSATVLLLLTIIGWVVGAVVFLLLARWCFSFVKETRAGRAFGGWVAIMPVLLGLLASSLASIACILMAVQAILQLAFLTLPELLRSIGA